MSNKMKTKSTFIKALLILVISGISIAASAQAPAGPSNPVIAPSAAAGGTPDRFICSNGLVQLNTTASAGQYIWYKQTSPGGPFVQVQSGASPNYSETPAGNGYYNYELQIVSATGCVSPMSSPFKIFVLPPINPTITGTTTVCANDGNNTTPVSLTASPNPGTDPNYTYTYQWLRNGSPVGTNSPTYTGTEAPVGTTTSVNYKVIVTYTSNFDSNCSGTGSTTVTVNPIPAQPTIQ
jgi:hypothetical protein